MAEKKEILNHLSIMMDRSRSTISALRMRNFGMDLPFQMLSESLPDGQAYYEFKDGHIEVQELDTDGEKFERKYISTLTEEEAEKVRLAYGLL